jgi:hypothetical protein
MLIQRKFHAMLAEYPAQETPTGIPHPPQFHLESRKRIFIRKTASAFYER